MSQPLVDGSDRARAAWMWEGLRFLSACADAHDLDTKTEPFYLATNAFIIELTRLEGLSIDEITKRIKLGMEPASIDKDVKDPQRAT